MLLSFVFPDQISARQVATQFNFQQINKVAGRCVTWFVKSLDDDVARVARDLWQRYKLPVTQEQWDARCNVFSDRVWAARIKVPTWIPEPLDPETRQECDEIWATELDELSFDNPVDEIVEPVTDKTSTGTTKDVDGGLSDDAIAYWESVIKQVPVNPKRDELTNTQAFVPNFATKASLMSLNKKHLLKLCKQVGCVGNAKLTKRQLTDNLFGRIDRETVKTVKKAKR